MKNAAIEAGVEAMKLDCADLIYENVMSLTSNAIRGCIVAPPGKKLVVSDLSNIEGRVLAYLAGEEWKLQAFRDFDAGIGEDLYKVAYGKAFKVPAEEATGDKRQIGKVMELMLGYEGGVGAYLTGAATYRIDLDHMSTMARPGIPEEVWNEAIKFWHWCHKTKRATYGLSKDVFCACDSLKRMWRLQHPNIVAFWGEVQDAVIAAIREPQVTFLCRKVRVRRTGEWLRIVLPSGRALCYPSPRLDDHGKISYEGVNQFSRKWCRISTYSGRLVENVTQAFARDVFKSSFIPVENAGYEIVLEVHDELITEVPDTEDFNVGRLSELLATNPPWAQGMPLAAAGFETYRYRKG
jgi:DNA polymerase